MSADAAVIALLKIVAYLDRPAQRARDLHDLAYLLCDYVETYDTRLWDKPA